MLCNFPTEGGSTAQGHVTATSATFRSLLMQSAQMSVAIKSSVRCITYLNDNACRQCRVQDKDSSVGIACTHRPTSLDKKNILPAWSMHGKNVNTEKLLWAVCVCMCAWVWLLSHQYRQYLVSRSIAAKTQLSKLGRRSKTEILWC